MKVNIMVLFAILFIYTVWSQLIIKIVYVVVMISCGMVQPQLMAIIILKKNKKIIK